MPHTEFGYVMSDEGYVAYLERVLLLGIRSMPDDTSMLDVNGEHFTIGPIRECVDRHRNYRKSVKTLEGADNTTTRSDRMQTIGETWRQAVEKDKAVLAHKGGRFLIDRRLIDVEGPLRAYVLQDRTIHYTPPGPGKTVSRTIQDRYFWMYLDGHSMEWTGHKTRTDAKYRYESNTRGRA